jgi:UDP-3-O-[3-hydroxymyristoyl] glucosamine N-acyltransferase
VTRIIQLESPISLEKLAGQLQAEFRGDPELKIQSVANLEHADSGSLSFFSGKRFLSDLQTTEAGVVILSKENSLLFPGNSIYSENPYATFSQAVGIMKVEEEPIPKRDQSAIIDDSAVIADNATIGAGVIIEAGVVIGEQVLIGNGSSIHRGVEIARSCRIGANVVIGRGVTLGERCKIEPGAVLGATGFGYTHLDEEWLPIPQLGSVIIGKNVDIGANSTIDRGTLGDTVIEDGVKIDNQVHIGHNVHIGAHTILAGCSAVAGSVKIGNRCRLGGRVGILDNLEITDDVHIAATSVVTRSIAEPGMYSSVVPAQSVAKWRRNIGRIRNLDRWAVKIEKKLKQEHKED